jgi:hypothetical protein
MNPPEIIRGAREGGEGNLDGTSSGDGVEGDLGDRLIRPALLPELRNLIRGKDVKHGNQ